MIRRLGILNTQIPEDHKWYGVPYAGTYMIDSDGVVFEKSFFANHGVRESVNDMLQEQYGVEDIERGPFVVGRTDELTAKAYFASPTLRPRQLTVLTVEVSLGDGLHVYGHPLPEGYVPTALEVDSSEYLKVERVDYPEPETMELKALGETLPVYTGKLTIKARCIGLKRGEGEHFPLVARLHYQACDDHQCFLPQTLTIPLTLQAVPNVG